MVDGLDPWLAEVAFELWFDSHAAREMCCERAANFHARTSDYIAKHELSGRFSVEWLHENKTAFIVRLADSPDYFAIRVLDYDTYDTLVYGEGASVVHKEVVVLDKLVDWFQKH